ncbi:chondroitin AC/alginate lyase [Mycena leptocephala]|nr:chondroitin AC/alginate lyase [Mycena leptocephala]
MFITLYLASCIAVSMAFVHPGIWHNSTNLAEIKAKSTSTNSVWKAAYAIFRDNSYTSSSYTLEVFRLLTPSNLTKATVHLQNDCKAAYQNALAWTITGDAAHATKAAQILDGWATTMTAIANPDQTILRLAIDGAMLINAAELLVHTGSGWTGSARFGAWIQKLFLPTLLGSTHSFNWGQAQMKTIMSAGVFFNNQTLYQYGLDLITGAKTQSSTLCEGTCCLGIQQAIDPEHGQVGESGRDQGHTQLELGHLSESCQIARSQGDGGACFATSSNLLAKGFEYTAVVLRNGTVVWNPDAFATCNDIWWSRSALAVPSLDLRPEYELPYAYYHSVAKLSVDNIGKIVTLQRPEGQEPAAGSIADSIGYGTLLWAY